MSLKHGFLSELFVGVAYKTLKKVEIAGKGSNQHEFNGSKALVRLFGKPAEKKTFEATFIYIPEENQAISEDGFITWGDVRQKHPTRSEYHLYYSSNLIANAEIGDIVFIALRPEGRAFVLIVDQRSDYIGRLAWLFGISDEFTENFNFSAPGKRDESGADYIAMLICDELGLQIEAPLENKALEAIRIFNGQFPTTAIFAQQARMAMPSVNAQDDPDAAIMLWLDMEYQMFRALEKQVLYQQLKHGFFDHEKDEPDVEKFLKLSNKVHNRRKSRMGLSLEHHVKAALDAFSIKYTWQGYTENKSQPDFLFPSVEKYHDPEFDNTKLDMLAVKSTCKDRWRQALSEANKIPKKYLFTIEPAISNTQLDEMKANNLQLVLPENLHSTYKEPGRLMNFQEFIDYLAMKQKTAP